MEIAQTRPWFSYDSGPFKGDEPFYFDTAEFPWVKDLEANWEEIRDELLALIGEQDDSMVPYPNKEMTSRPNQWKTFGLMFWTVKSKTNCEKCPRTWELLKNIPHLTAASFNLLEAGTTIKPHHGDTNAIIRCHLGLEVPAPAPQCAFRVGTETRSWEEGKMLMFCDAHTHTAWNNTGRKRYILVLDIMRPGFVGRKNATCARVLSSIYMEVAYQRRPWLRRYFGGKAGRAVVFNLFKAFFRTSLTARLPFSRMPS